MFGGAMRQSGMLAAAGIYALDHQYERLSQDHDNAKYFAQNIQNMDRSMIDVEGTETNLVYFGFEGIDPHKLERKLRDRRVYLFAERPGQVRAVMHLGISREHVEETLTIIQEVSKEK
jgi:threonine aldolase